MSEIPKRSQTAAHVHLRELPGVHYAAEELGAVHRANAADLLAALALVKKGEIYDLDSGRWPGMPMFAAHPPFVLTSYRSPRGVRNQHDLDGWLGENRANMALNTDLLIGTVHTGTHVDALSHITCGPDSHWHGGYHENEHLGDFGPLAAEASSMPPFVCRGVLIDVAKSRNVDILDGGSLIGADEIERISRSQGTRIDRGDAVLIRTGYMQAWGIDVARSTRHVGAGIGHDAAVYLGERGVVLVGSDTETLEVNPSVDPRNPHPVHIELLIERGIHILELAHLEDLARDQVYEFLFVCLPLRIVGATGSMTRPVAIV